MGLPKPMKTGAMPARLPIWEVARLYIEDMHLDPGLSNKLLGFVRSRDVSRLADSVSLVAQLHGEDVWRSLRQLSSLFKKNDSFANDAECTLEAYRTFLKAETTCRITNKRIDHYAQHMDRLPPDILRWISAMQRDISSLLGDRRAFLDEIPKLIRLTDGATEDRSRRRSLPFLKISGRMRLPKRAHVYLTTLMKYWGMDTSNVRLTDVDENRVTFVPKNWKTHRTIACEPTHLLPFQLAIHEFFVRKLRRWGIDLRNQSLNQEKARIGSLDGSLATVDLKTASDTCAVNSVALLFPDDWYLTLRAFRSSSFRIESEHLPEISGTYAKISSMGNGFTFSVETLIFTAACRAIGSKEYQVYGDDIVVESILVPDLERLLRFLGFRFNVDKTFADPNGRFRESCGCDWYNGVLITPWYCRRLPLVDQRADMAHAVNGLTSIAVPGGRLWEYLLELVINMRLAIVPYNTDSRSGVFVHPSTAHLVGNLKHTNCIPWFKGYGPVPEHRTNRGWRSLLAWYIQAGGPSATAVKPSRYRIPGVTWFGLDHNREIEIEIALACRSANSVSEIAVGTRYVHMLRTYTLVRN